MPEMVGERAPAGRAEAGAGAGGGTRPRRAGGRPPCPPAFAGWAGRGCRAVERRAARERSACRARAVEKAAAAERGVERDAVAEAQATMAEVRAAVKLA